MWSGSRATALRATARGPGLAARRTLATGRNAGYRQRFSKVLMDRFQPAVVEPQGLTPLSFGWREQKKSKLGGAIKTQMALHRIRQVDPSFDSTRFLSEAHQTFQELQLAITAARLDRLYEISTEYLADLIMESPPPYRRLVDTEKLTTLTNVLEPPSVVQARLVKLDETDPSNRAEFAQVTVRLVVESRAMSRKDLNQLESRRGKGSKRNQGGSDVLARSQRISNSDDEPSRVLLAFDSTGGTYFWNSSTKQASYAKPPNMLISPVYWRPWQGTLGSEGRVIEFNELSQRWVIEHLVTFERPLHKLYTPWRVAFF